MVKPSDVFHLQVRSQLGVVTVVAAGLHHHAFATLVEGPLLQYSVYLVHQSARTRLITLTSVGSPCCPFFTAPPFSVRR